LEQSHTLEQTSETLLQAFSDVDGFTPSLLLSTVGLPAGYYRILRACLSDGTRDDAWDEEPVDVNSVRSGGTMAAIISHPRPQLIQDADWTHDPYFSEALDGYSSVMAIPLVGNRLPMNWAIVLKRPPERFSEPDLEEAVERAALSCALLENQLLAADLTRAHERIDRDARQVGQLQRALLPASLPRNAGLQIAASYEPASRAGGDLYDFFPLNGAPNNLADGGVAASRWCAFIGDASGHGLAAAVVMAIVQAVLHAHPRGIDGPATLLAHANRQLCDKGIGGFFTAFLGIYEPGLRRLTYANAGHPAPLVKRASSNQIESLDAVVSYPLGIDATEAFTETTVRLERNDMILLYTDGITESRRGRDDWFGQESLARVMREARGGPAELIDQLRAAVREYQHRQPAPDDQTLVAALVL
jgi:sigma-B regulation protein RsbU (phosphoserine phosphatase)